MMVNYDCIRDVLKSLAVNLEMKNGGIISVALPKIKTYPEIQQYEESDIIYSLVQLEKENYIEASFHYGSGNKLCGLTVFDVLPDGHSLLKDISSDTIWSKAKAKASKAVGEVSLSCLRKIAVALIDTAVTFLT